MRLGFQGPKCVKMVLFQEQKALSEVSRLDHLIKTETSINAQLKSANANLKNETESKQ